MASLSRLAILSYHTSPLALPGRGDSGGMNVYVRETARRIAASGTAVDVFTRRTNGIGDGVVEIAPGLRVVPIEAGPACALKDELAGWTDAFARGVEGFATGSGARYEGLLSHYWLSGLAGIRLAGARDVPHAVAFHTLALAKQAVFADEPADPARVEGERRIVEEADAILAAGRHERDELTGRYRADAEKIRLAPPGVDSDLFYPRDRVECRRRLGLPLDGPLVLMVGRDVPLKGAQVLERALGGMPAERRPEALFVGGETDGARRVGAVPQEELALYYGAADFAVAPSFYESFGMAALEAQACGRAVVASAVGGLPSVVEDGRTGLLFRAGDHEALAAATAWLLADGARVEQMGRAAAEAVRGRSWDVTALATLDALRADRLVRVGA